MKYVWTEDTGAGLHFWKLINQLFFDNKLTIESKGSNQGSLRCGKPEAEGGSEKMKLLIQSEKVQKVIGRLLS